MRRNLIWVIGMMAAVSLVFTSCGDDDDDTPPVAPVLSIDNATASGDIGDVINATISGTLDGAFSKLEISKFIGTAPDNSYGTNGVLEVTTGLPYSFSHTIGSEGVDSPIRFSFKVTDANDLSDEVELVITTNAPVEDPPVLTIDNATAAGDLGEEVNATITGEFDGAFAKMEISKFIGTTLDDSYGTNGVLEVTSELPYDFSYTIGIEGLDIPIKFTFKVTDANDLTDEVDLTITTEPTNAGLLTAFNWRYSSLAQDGAEFILECEEDNVYSFEADGSMSVDFGALTGAGGGSCDFDGFGTLDGWDLNDAQDTLRWFRGDAFTGTPTDTVTYAIKEFTKSQWVADETNLFGVFEYTYTAVAK
ncbi:MAG: hypothetical protein RIF33_04880 [Cyclobacteriaceae bacterium]